MLDERAEREAEPFNLTQLAIAMGVARESVSRRVNDQIGMTDKYAARFAAVLGITPAELLPPSVEPVSLATVSRHLESLEERVDEVLAGVSDVLTLLRAAHAESGAGAPKVSQ